MIRLFIPHDLAAGAELRSTHGQSRYLAAVMRQGVGRRAAAVQRPRRRVARERSPWSASGRWALQRRAAGRGRRRPGPDLDLVIALVKRGRLETIVEKAAELGARRVRPVITERTNADRARVERLTAIATEAAEQTGRLDVPRVAGAGEAGQAARRLGGRAAAAVLRRGRRRHAGAGGPGRASRPGPGRS